MVGSTTRHRRQSSTVSAHECSSSMNAMGLLLVEPSPYGLHPHHHYHSHHSPHGYQTPAAAAARTAYHPFPFHNSPSPLWMAPPPPPRKQVRFGPAYSYDPPPISQPLRKADLWYTAKELEHFRVTASWQTKSLFVTTTTTTTTTTTSPMDYQQDDNEEDENDDPEQVGPTPPIVPSSPTLQRHKNRNQPLSSSSSSCVVPDAPPHAHEQPQQQSHQSVAALSRVLQHLHKACCDSDLDDATTYPCMSFADQQVLAASSHWDVWLGLERWTKPLRHDKAQRLQQLRQLVIDNHNSTTTTTNRWSSSSSSSPHVTSHSSSRHHRQAPSSHPLLSSPSSTTSTMAPLSAFYHQYGDSQVPPQQDLSSLSSDEWMRVECERISLPSRLFAFYIANAQLAQRPSPGAESSSRRRRDRRRHVRKRSTDQAVRV